MILFAGGHGGLQISSSGSFKWGAGNFLVRTRQLFADQGLMVVVVDAPSDRQSAPFLGGFRQKAEHAADIKAVIAWAREQTKVPVWLVGTSRGTQSAAFVATELGDPRVRTESCSHRRSSPMTKVGLFLRCRSKSYAFLCWWSTTNRTAAGTVLSATFPL